MNAVDDRALCLHEAAHAVTGEVFRPGCVLGVEMDYEAETPSRFTGFVYGAGTEAVCSWRLWDWNDPNLYVAIAAGREGEKLVEGTSGRFDGGDRALLRHLASSWQRRRARRRAESLVRKHELAIRRVAKALGEKRVLTGDEVRELIA